MLNSQFHSCYTLFYSQRSKCADLPEQLLPLLFNTTFIIPTFFHFVKNKAFPSFIYGNAEHMSVYYISKRKKGPQIVALTFYALFSQT